MHLAVRESTMMVATSLSRKIVVVTIILFLLALFGLLGMVLPYVLLFPDSVIPGLELWRLATYPLGIGFGSLILTAITFSIPGEEVEQFLGARRFGILLASVVLGVGLFHTLIFFGQPYPPLGGPENIALFVLVGYVYLYPHSEIHLIFFSLRSGVLLGIVVGVILVVSLISTLQGGHALTFFINGGFGLIAGAAYFHFRYQKYPVLLGPIRGIERAFSRRSDAPATRESRPTLQFGRGGLGGGSAGSRAMEEKGGEGFSEERLNRILDRISEKGYEGLTEEEKKFLRDYSNKL